MWVLRSRGLERRAAEGVEGQMRKKFEIWFLLLQIKKRPFQSVTVRYAFSLKGLRGLGGICQSTSGTSCVSCSDPYQHKSKIRQQEGKQHTAWERQEVILIITRRSIISGIKVIDFSFVISFFLSFAYNLSQSLLLAVTRGSLNFLKPAPLSFALTSELVLAHDELLNG